MAPALDSWPYTLGKDVPSPHEGHGKAGSTRSLTGVVSVAQTDQLSNYPVTHPGL